MKEVLSLVTMAILLTVSIAFGQCNTTISGVINDQVWNTEGSPYCVEGDLFIQNLSIEPGVKIEFQGDFVFEVTGVLTAVGTKENPILFTAADEADGWQGILFDHTPPGSLMKYCHVEKSKNSGIRIINASPILQLCSISNNHSDVGGGGMNIVLDSSSDSLLLTSCDISSNTSSTHGGGLYITVSSGSMTLEDCKINNNRTNVNHSLGNFYGGGIYVASAAAGLTLKNCYIKDNITYSRCSGTDCRSYGYGGGIYIRLGNVSLINSIIDSNLATTGYSGYRAGSIAYGGGIFLIEGIVELKNTIVSNNSLTASIYERGGGIYNTDGTVSCENTTIAYNSEHGIYNADGIVHIVNSIVYFNSASSIAGNASVSYSDIEMASPDEVYDGDGNINVDPLFESIFNLKIRCDYSPCVDTGSPQPWYNDTCIAPSCGSALNDMGAYGGPGACGWCAYGGQVCQPPQTGDLDGDGDVDATDLVIFSANYGSGALLK